MRVVPLTSQMIPDVKQLIELGDPYLRVRGSSDYWLYSKLFSSTCPVALIDEQIAGIVIAFRSQDDPSDVYVQDVMTHPNYRRRGVAKALLRSVEQRAKEWGCERLYLTSEPENADAHTSWLSLGFTNVSGDRLVNGVSVVSDYKGPGMDRAAYELVIR